MPQQTATLHACAQIQTKNIGGKYKQKKLFFKSQKITVMGQLYKQQQQQYNPAANVYCYTLTHTATIVNGERQYFLDIFIIETNQKKQKKKN